MKWTVTSQHYYYSGERVVEIVLGCDQIGPDAIMPKYRNELAEFEDPREVVEAAIKIAEQWQTDCPGLGETGVRQNDEADDSYCLCHIHPRWMERMTPNDIGACGKEQSSG